MKNTAKKPPPPQASLSKKAAELKTGTATTAVPQAVVEANEKYLLEEGLAARSDHHEHDRQHVHAAQAPPAKQVTAARKATNLTPQLLGRHEIVALTGLTYPTLWSMMRAGTFPRSRVVGGKSKWFSNEVESWAARLPVRRLKGDKPSGEAA